MTSDSQYSILHKSNHLPLPHLFVVLNWGRGHATRSIPIIQGLLDQGIDLVLGADGEARSILEGQFPNLAMEQLPSLNLKATSHVARAILWQFPKILGWFIQDFLWMRKRRHRFEKVYSDGRLGMILPRIKTSVFINHQWGKLTPSFYGVFLGLLTHLCIFLQVDIWIPGTPNLWPISLPQKFKATYLGPISAIQKCTTTEAIDICISLSGSSNVQDRVLQKLIPILKELQASFEVMGYSGNRFDFPAFVSGQKRDELWAKARLVIGFLGFSTLLDVDTHNKKALLIAINGQWEQELLLKNTSFDGPIIGYSEMEFLESDQIKEILKNRLS